MLFSSFQVICTHYSTVLTKSQALSEKVVKTAPFQTRVPETPFYAKFAVYMKKIPPRRTKARRSGKL